MKWTEDVNCKTMWRDMASSNDTALRHDTDMTADSFNLLDWQWRGNFSDKVMFVAMMMKET